MMKEESIALNFDIYSVVYYKLIESLLDCWVNSVKYL